MSRTNIQQLIAELRQPAMPRTLSDQPAPIERFSGTTAGGAALAVENQASAQNYRAGKWLTVQSVGSSLAIGAAFNVLVFKAQG